MAHDKDGKGLLSGPIITGPLMAWEATRPRAQVYEVLVAHLTRSGMADRALRPGDPMPDFLLPSADGKLLGRDALLANGPLLLSFVRGQWCHYCRAEMQALQALAGTSVQLAVVTPEVGGRAQAAQKRLGLTYQMLCDIDSGLALACGLLFRVPDEVRVHYMEAGIDLPLFHGNDGWMLPVPATYGIGTDGIVRFAHLDVDFRSRLDPAVFVAAMAELGS